MAATVPILTESAEILAARKKWQFDGSCRPSFAHATGPGQESVWDFPRPPAVELVRGTLKVSFANQVLATTQNARRVLETAGAPTYYFPKEDVSSRVMPGDPVSVCEWKGVAQSMLFDGEEVGWRYCRMFAAFAELFEWVSFYPSRVDCFIDDEHVQPQPGGFYGGWVSQNLTGPIKGVPGSSQW